MKAIRNILGGLAGAVALNLLHETIKRLDHQAPRIDLVGEEAVSKIIKSTGAKAPRGNALFASALAGDLISNALYYSLIGKGGKKHLLLRGIGYGAAAGISALKLTRPLGLSDAPITRTQKTKALTVGYYIFGGVITALMLRNLNKDSSS